MVKLLDTSGKNEIDAIKLEINTTITKESKSKDKDNNNNSSTYKYAHRKYYLKNREKILQREHQRYIENREYWKDYYERTKDKKNNNNDKAA